jgi:hypothetical protein
MTDLLVFIVAHRRCVELMQEKVEEKVPQSKPEPLPLTGKKRRVGKRNRVAKSIV